MAATITPIVSIATLKTCIDVYLFPHIQPTKIVVTLPPLLRMMCTGTDILYPNAKLLSMLTVKNKTTFGSHLSIGMVGRLRKYGGSDEEK